MAQRTAPGTTADLDFTRPYCLVDRDGATTFYSGELVRSWALADAPGPAAGRPVVSMVPYSQIRERGFLCHGEDEPILSLVVASQQPVDLADVADVSAPVTLVGEPTFAPDDKEFTEQVARVIAEEIRRGEGSNFLLSRQCQVVLANFSAEVAHTILARLVRNETDAYMSFCFFDGDQWFVGASPERHLSHSGGTVMMNPICGTLARSALQDRSDLLDFLNDPKERNELFQVVDEELKIMSRICSSGGRIKGPFLKEMGEVVHTEYVLEGRATLGPMDAFRESMFAPTMIGSPLENAARVIHRHETASRRYYTSAIVLRKEDEDGQEVLDSAITIRTMEVDTSGRAVIRSGASIVRDSVPERECQEVHAKARGMLRAIASPEHRGPFLDAYVDDAVRDVLTSRNDVLSRFWMDAQGDDHTSTVLAGRTVLVIDNEDQFTEMLRHIIERLGMKVSMARYEEVDLTLGGFDLVLVGPGPGDPNDLSNPKMSRLRDIVDGLLASGTPFLSVCLGHQVLCRALGLEVVAVDPPLQGVQQVVDLFGREEAVGFYNTFFGLAPTQPPAGVEVAAGADGRVIAVRSPSFVGFQFHVESVLTRNCTAIIREALEHLLG